jgi:GNAT superfamily N-acetyltransferase/acyl carrier protein
MSTTRHEGAADSRETEARRLALRRELRALIRSWNPALSSDVDEHSSLIASGVIDSLSLFNLILWIEAKSGRTIDPAVVNVTRDWDSIAAILQYLDPSPEGGRVGASEPVTAARRQSRYRVVTYRPEFKRAVAEFQTGLWSPDPDRNLRYLEWKYEDNPYADHGHIYLAFDDGELVGMRGFYPSRWQIGLPPRVVPLLVADDLLVSEQHRNKGLVSDIMSAARDDLRRLGERYVINLSGGTLTVLESLAMGWRTAGMLSPMSRQSSSGPFSAKLGRLLTKLTRAPRINNRHRRIDEPSPFSRLDRARNPHRTEFGLDVEIDTRPRIPAMIDLLGRIGYGGRVRHVRDEGYLEWRYRNPFREYRFLYSADAALNGFLVLRRATDRVPPRRQVSIVDLEAINDRVASALLETAVHAGSFEELDVWAATISAPAVTQLRTLGFHPAKGQLTTSGTPYLLVWSLDGSEGEQWRLEGVDLLDLSRWDLRTIYSMFG